MIRFKGQSLTVSDWSKKTGLPRHVIYRRMELGWSVRDILTTPVNLRCSRGGGREPLMLTFDGQTRSLREWAEHIGIRRCTLYQRLFEGWSVEETLSTPLLRRNPGVVGNFVTSQGTGGGPTMRDPAEIEFLQNEGAD